MIFPQNTIPKIFLHFFSQTFYLLRKKLPKNPPSAPKMVKKSTLLALFVVLSFAMALIVNGFYIDPSTIIPEAYCGIQPYPQSIPAIPPLNNLSRSHNLIPIDQHVFFRHGDRSTIGKNCFKNLPEFADRIWTECPYPIRNFPSGLINRSPNDGDVLTHPYRFEVKPLPGKGLLNGNCHFGQLTTKGALMSYNNGSRYVRYLNQTMPAPISIKQFKARSTDYHRTRETGTSFLSGVFDSLGDIYPLPADFLPVNNSPVQYFVDNKVDALDINYNMCSTTEYYNVAYKDPKWVEYDTKVYKPLEAKLRQILKDDNADMYEVFDCLKTAVCHNNPHPSGLTNQIHKEIEAALLNYYQQAFQYDHKLANILFTGVWASEMIPMLNAAMDRSYKDHTFYLNSGHDSNVQAIMELLNFGNKRWPAYSALLQIELYKEALNVDNVWVRFLYDGEVVIPEFCKLSVVSNELCPVPQFIKLLTDSLPRNGECKTIPPRLMEEFKNGIVGLVEKLEFLEQNGSNNNCHDDNSGETISKTVSDNINAFINDNYNIQHKLKAEESQDVEISHVERWAKMSP
jgi:hypothetical protein